MFHAVGCRGGCGEDGCEFFFGFENVVDCETAAVVFHSLGVDVDECQDVLDAPTFAVLVFGHQVGDFDSCARVEVFTEDAADSTADAAADDDDGRRCFGGGCLLCEAWVACFREDFDVVNQHVHVCQDAHTVIDSVEGIGLVGGGAGEYDGGGEREER